VAAEPFAHGVVVEVLVLEELDDFEVEDDLAEEVLEDLSEVVVVEVADVEVACLPAFSAAEVARLSALMPGIVIVVEVVAVARALTTLSARVETARRVMLVAPPDRLAKTSQRCLEQLKLWNVPSHSSGRGSWLRWKK
jgi:hypothetical protein